MFGDSRTYPSGVIRNMLKLEQELAKADEQGLILTAADLQPDYCTVCQEKVAIIGDKCTDCWFNDLPYS